MEYFNGETDKHAQNHGDEYGPGRPDYGKKCTEEAAQRNEPTHVDRYVLVIAPIVVKFVPTRRRPSA